MKFRYVMAGYAGIWIVLIAGICAYEWKSLKQFQAEYENEQASGIEDFMQQTSGSKAADTDNTADINNTAHTNNTDIAKRQRYTFTADSTMTVYLNGKAQDFLPREELEDEIYSDVSQLLGRQIKKYKYTIEKSESDILEVKNNEGKAVIPVKDDFTEGACLYDKNIADGALKAFEHYLKHIGGMVTLQELTEVMRHDSKAYRAVQNSQQSLKWMIKAKSIEFKREELNSMRFFDKNHFSCDISIDLVKTSDTEHERKLEETVNYAVLYENIDGKWLIYSFVTK